MIIDFNIANSRLSYTSQTDNGQIQTQLRFSFDDGWTGLIKTAVFIPSAKTAPLSICLDSENSCFAAAEAAGDYKMYMVGSDSTENIAITTNAVDVTLTQGNVIVIPPSTTAALIDELNADAASIKADVSAAAQAAETLTKAAEDYETYKSEIDTAVATKANQSDVDTINAVLSGAIKNKGDVKSLTIPLPVTDKSMLNCAYNVIDGWIPAQDSTIYAWAPFQYKLTLNHIRVFVLDGTYCLSLSTDTDIPAELWYHSTLGTKEFYNEPQTVAIMMNDTVQRFTYTGYSPTQTPYEKLLIFEWVTTPGSADISSFRDAQDWVYTADNVAAAWSVNMNIDNNFIITEHGFDIQSYKITNYVTSYQFNSLKNTVDGKVDKETGKGLSTNDFTTALKIKLNNDYSRGQIDTKISALQDGKANADDVYTKTEIDSAGYVKNTDYASYAKGGVVKIGNSNYGVALNSNNELYTVKATNAQIAARDNDCVLIAPRNLNAAVKAALTDDKRISDMTDAEKANARDVIGANGKYDTIIDYTYTGDETATELNILLTQEQLQKIKKYEKFFCYVTYNVSATTGTTSFWASATLNLCIKGTTTLLSYGGIFMRAVNTVQKITADNTPITWIATADKVRLPDSNVCIMNVLDYGATQYSLFNISTLTGGSSRVISPVLYQYSGTNYDWVMQLKSPTAMPFVNGMKFIMWGK